jgi:ABC-2 type transport system permease protein
MQTFPVQLWDLLLIQLTNWRWAWRATIVTGLVAPALSMLAFSAFVGSDSEALGYILTGNLVMSLLFGTSNRLSSNFAFMRVTGMLDLFAALPVYRVALILASATAFLLLGLPTVLVIIALGGTILDLSLSVSPWALLVIPLIAYSLCGLGALIGTINRPLEDIAGITNLTTFMMLFIGPVMLPPERIHPLLETVGYFSPVTYAASALRHVLLDQPDHTPFAIDLLVLCAMLVGFLWWSARRMSWRQV